MPYGPESLDDASDFFPPGAALMLVSADAGRRTRLRALLETHGCRVDEFMSPHEAAIRLKHLGVDAVLVDAEGPDAESWELGCASLLAARPARSGVPPVVLVASEREQASVARLMDQGAADFIAHTSSNGDIILRIGMVIRSRRVPSHRKSEPDVKPHVFRVDRIDRKQPTRASTAVPGVTASADMVLGRTDAIRDVLDSIRLVADRQTTVLITGETGTGKERIARALHAAGNRSAHEMVSVNCAGIPANLLEDEFFGHVKGAFTDAHQDRVGRFEQARGSSIFLDEIGDLPLELQPKLLRVLQEREVHRIGGLETVRLDARVIAATNADLWASVREGRFREDLFYRLNVFPINLPALRERREDIPLFLNHFLDAFRRRDGLPPKVIHLSAEADLMARSWPGNIRELENAVERAVILSGDRRTLDTNDFPASCRPRALSVDQFPSTHRGRDYKTMVEQFERDLISRVLEETNGNKTLAAEQLRLNRTTLIEKWKKLQQGLAVHVHAAAC